MSDDLEARALKPCPFCGGEAKRLTIGDDDPSNAGGDVIVCTGMCGCSSHVEFCFKENLVSLWNTRSLEKSAATPDDLQARARAILANDLKEHGFQSCAERVLYDEWDELLSIETSALRAIVSALERPAAPEEREAMHWLLRKCVVHPNGQTAGEAMSDGLDPETDDEFAGTIYTAFDRMADAILALRPTVSDGWERIETAARALIAARMDTYQARNGRYVGIEDSNGEKCWIVPFDEMHALETALPTPPILSGDGGE